MSDANNLVGAPLPRRTHEIQKLIDATSSKIEEANKRIEILSQIKDKLESLSFSEGDIVLTKSGDRAIVCGIGFIPGEEAEAAAFDADLIDKMTVTLATKKGFIRVPVDEVLPLNITTKVLYSNERN